MEITLKSVALETGKGILGIGGLLLFVLPFFLITGGLWVSVLLFRAMLVAPIFFCALAGAFEILREKFPIRFGSIDEIEAYRFMAISAIMGAGYFVWDFWGKCSAMDCYYQAMFGYKNREEYCKNAQHL